MAAVFIALSATVCFFSESSRRDTEFLETIPNVIDALGTGLHVSVTINILYLNVIWLKKIKYGNKNDITFDFIEQLII